MSKIQLKKDAHLFQMIGNIDDRNSYGLPKDIAEILIKIPKVPVVSKDEIDVGANVAFMQSAFDVEGSPLEFCLEDSTLSLVEHASEAGGLLSFTYLVPLAELTVDYFNCLDYQTDISPICERIKKRRSQYAAMITEYERLAKSAARRVKKTFSNFPVPQYDEMLASGKRFIRHGKPDYHTSQLNLLEFVLEKNDTVHPATQIINAWKTACNNRTSAKILSEPPTAELHEVKKTSVKKSGTTKNKNFDFKLLLASMLKQDTKKKPQVRLKSSKHAAEIIESETEVEQEFSPPPEDFIADTENEKEKIAEEEIKTQQELAEQAKLQELAAKLLENKTEKKTPVKEVSLQGMKKDLQEELAPDSLNRGL